jgi:DNA-3-methyladenine glycosylase I
VSAEPGPDGRLRCPWALQPPEYLAYHDDEWGRPVRDDIGLYERLTLEAFQSGLSWLTILRKRPGFRRAFAGFDPEAVARFGARDVKRLLGDAGIVRHKGKIEAAIANAQAVLAVQEEAGSFDAYVWSFVGGSPIKNRFRSLGELPAKTAESTAMSKDLKRRGFRFVGPTTCYSFMQATGLVNDHTVDFFRYAVV